MMLYISVRDHARKLKFCSYIHLPSINKMFQYRYARVILRGAGEDIKHNVLLECINKIYKYGHDWVI